MEEVVIMPEGEKNEKSGTLMTDVSYQEVNTQNTELLETIDGKLDTLIQMQSEGE